ncbi:MAG: polyketide synthase dehydratase domain-containing protein, partial [Acidobacteriia bacterium]|nr:polyketide synthase dehydratase domain-containing protein [Terriglobia bacterium]
EEFLQTEEAILKATVGQALRPPAVNPARGQEIYPTPAAPPVIAPPALAVVAQPAPPSIAPPVQSRESAPAPAPADLTVLLLRVVSDRTGYPQEMLGLDQDLEADLGIDSIKRVEIFGALRELSTETALGDDGDMEAVAKLKTLRQVLEFLEQKMPAGSASASAGSAPAAPRLNSLLHTASVIQHTPGESLTLALSLDLNEHLYVKDHSLYYPASERNNQTNRIYVMPLTGSLELMCQAAALLGPGLQVTGCADMQVFRPLNAAEDEEPTRIQIAAKVHARSAVADALEVRVTIREDKPSGGVLSQSTVLLDRRFADAPLPIEVPLKNARAPMCSGRDVYETHRMFHGPSFQGICAIDQVAENGLHAKLEILPVDKLLRSEPRPEFQIDPYLLDAAGQLVGYWPLEYLDQGFVVLPVKVAGLVKYCENPPPGTVLDYRLRLRHVNQRTLAADYDVILPDGRLWLRVTGWEDWRFYWPPTIYNCWRWPKTEYPSAPVSVPALESRGYQCRLFHMRGDQEREGLAGEVWMRILLNRRETPEFERVRLEDRPNWLLLRITAKDAVRSWTFRYHDRPLFPADIEIESHPDGRLQAGGFWAAEVPVPKIAAWLTGPVSVAVAGPAQCSVLAVDAGECYDPECLLPDELDWLRRAPDRSEWLLRAVAAKQVAARYLNPAGSGEYWKSLVLVKMDANQGMMEVADPGSAVNAEDTVSVATAREGETVIAVAFK